MPPSPRADARWLAAVDEHQVAVAAFLDAAARVPADAWTQPWSPGKWTPGQITEHMILAYRALVAEVTEGTTMRMVLPRFRRALLRTVLLPHILFHRKFPLRARAPREVRPGDGVSREDGTRTLRALVDRFEAAAAERHRAGGGHLTHPYFGAVDLTRGMRFCAVHLDHHRQQIAAAGA